MALLIIMPTLTNVGMIILSFVKWKIRIQNYAPVPRRANDTRRIFWPKYSAGRGGVCDDKLAAKGAHART
jgi:hypothetical protein